MRAHGTVRLDLQERQSSDGTDEDLKRRATHARVGVDHLLSFFGRHLEAPSQICQPVLGRKSNRVYPPQSSLF